MRARNTARSLPAPFTDAQLAVIARMVDAAVMGERERLNEEFDRFLEERLGPLLAAISRLQDPAQPLTAAGERSIRAAGSVATFVLQTNDRPWSAKGRERVEADKRVREELRQKAIEDEIAMNRMNGAAYSGESLAVFPVAREDR